MPDVYPIVDNVSSVHNHRIEFGWTRNQFAKWQRSGESDVTKRDRLKFGHARAKAGPTLSALPINTFAPQSLVT